jgi:hypothetical protein
MDKKATAATLIQCTNSKRDTPAAARDLYDESRYFRVMRSWAHARDVPWFILSAKHGLLDPDDHIAPYDSVGLSEQQATEIATELRRRGVREAHICAGSKYTDPLIPELEQQGIDVVDNFAGMKIGKRQQALKRRMRELTHEPLTDA